MQNLFCRRSESAHTRVNVPGSGYAYMLCGSARVCCDNVFCNRCVVHLQGFQPLMSAHRVQDLARMYSLLSRVGGTDALRDEWRQYITTTGTAIVKDEANVSAACSKTCRTLG
jgi:hypothetical protein